MPPVPGGKPPPVGRLVAAVREAADLGIGAVCVFPYTGPEDRTEDCARAWDPENAANRAIAAIKREMPQMLVMTDVALDTYNANGHDGFVEDGIIVNDRTGAVSYTPLTLPTNRAV